MSDTLDSTAAASTPLLHSLRAYPAYRTLFNSTLATNGAYWMWMMAGGWLALDLTDSAFFVGLTGFAAGIPMLIFTLPAGVLLDRFDRRRILLAAQAVVTVISTIVVFLLFLDMMAPWHLLIASFGAGTAMSFVFPARNALVANLVPAKHLANAIALNSAGQNSTRVVGPALAGPFIAAAGLPYTFLICMVLQIAAMFVTVRLPTTLPVVGSGARRTMWGSIGDGLRVIGRNRYLTGIFILAAVPTVFFMSYSNLLPVFARDVFGIGSVGLGLMMAMNGLGGVIGALIVAGLPRLTNRPGVLLWTATGFGLIILGFSRVMAVFPALVLIFLAGLVSAVYMAINNTEIQLAVDDSVRGRVLGVYLFTWGLLPLGVLPAGILAGRFGAPLATSTMAMVGLVFIIVTMLRFPSLRGSAASPAVVTSPEAQRS